MQHFHTVMALRASKEEDRASSTSSGQHKATVAANIPELVPDSAQLVTSTEKSVATNRTVDGSETPRTFMSSSDPRILRLIEQVITGSTPARNALLQLSGQDAQDVLDAIQEV